MEWLTKVQRGQRTQIVKDRGFYVDYSSELVQTPKKSALQDSEQLQLNTIKAESTEECQLWAQSLPHKTSIILLGFTPLT